MKLKEVSLLFSVILFFHFSVLGQMKKADTYYTNYAYYEAIPLYLKQVKKNNTEAIAKLANCYRLIKNYEKAEHYYEKLFDLLDSADIEPVYRIYYGEVLLNNHKIEQAKEQFTIYSQKVTNDPRSETFLKSCIISKLWRQKPEDYEISNVAEVNSSLADMCPVLYKQGIVFASDRKEDLVNNRFFGWTGKPYLSVFYAKKSRKESGIFNTPSLFSKRIRSDYHTGPVCFNAKGETIYFTKVEKSSSLKKKDVISRPKIYRAILKNKRWTNIEPFFLNNDEYSVAHPALSPDGQLLFFTSDMPGGHGGKDLYVCKKEGEKWGEPQNLGAEINTPGDEVFPYIAANGILYFSSNGHVGLGGLDIYSARQVEGNWTAVANLGTPVNASTDDFGIVFHPDFRAGYFSSNRPGGKGSDDIYRFVYKAKTEKITSISGKLMLNELDPAQKIKVKLINEKGDVVQEIFSDAVGVFIFEKLDPDQQYIVLLDAENTGITFNQKDSRAYAKLTYNDSIPAAYATLVVLNKNENQIQQFVADEKGFFKFENLKADAYVIDSLKTTDTHITFKKKLTVVGKVLSGEKSDEPVEGIEIILQDRSGNELERTVSNTNGIFRFENLPTDQNYMLIINEEDPKLVLKKKHVVIGKLLINGQPAEPAIGNIIKLGGEKGALLKSTETDSEGFFRFESLTGDYNKLSLLNAENTSLNVNLKEGMMMENIYYDLGKWGIRSEAAGQLNKVVSILKANPFIEVELSSHTDSRASDDYNKKLSEKRAQAAVNYIISKGGDPIRIHGKGFGEAQLINRCENGVKCTEEEHRQNRRTEFKIIKRNK